MTRTERPARRHFFTTLAALASAPEGARAQWTTTGNDISNANSGNVGVGTSAPEKLFTVQGQVPAVGGTMAVVKITGANHGLGLGLDATASNHVVASTAAYDTGVAGVVSEQPGIILGESGAGKVMVATTDRVKVKVDAANAPVKIGDLLVTSDVAGVAMKSEPVGARLLHAPGTIIGKALEPLAGGVGEILVLLSLQ